MYVEDSVGRLSFADVLIAMLDEVAWLFNLRGSEYVVLNHFRILG